MSAAMIQLVGGQFQDAEGNPLSGGYLTLLLSQDCSVNDSQIAAGIEIKIYLDAYGSAIDSPGQFVWGNDVLSPVPNYYRVTGYTAEGQTAWGPNNQQIEGTGTFDLGLWTPNSVISWFPALQNAISLEVNSQPASSQTLQNLVEGPNVTLTDLGSGQVEVSANASGGTIAPRTIWTADSFSSILTYGGSFGPGGNANEIFTYPFNLYMGTTIGHVSSQVYGGPYGGGGGAFSFAISTLDGLTKVFYAGPNLFSALVSGLQVKAVTPFNLPAGAYRLAFSQADATMQYTWGVDINDSPDIWNMGYAGVDQPGVATSSNFSGSGCAMPATLGTFTANTNTGWPSFLLQP